MDTSEPNEESEVETLDTRQETELVKGQIVEATENIELDDDKSKRTTQIRKMLDPILKQELVSFLTQRKHVFA